MECCPFTGFNNESISAFDLRLFGTTFCDECLCLQRTGATIINLLNARAQLCYKYIVFELIHCHLSVWLTAIQDVINYMINIEFLNIIPSISLCIVSSCVCKNHVIMTVQNQVGLIAMKIWNTHVWHFKFIEQFLRKQVNFTIAVTCPELLLVSFCVGSSKML